MGQDFLDLTDIETLIGIDENLFDLAVSGGEFLDLLYQLHVEVVSRTGRHDVSIQPRSQ